MDFYGVSGVLGGSCIIQIINFLSYCFLQNRPTTKAVYSVYIHVYQLLVLLSTLLMRGFSITNTLYTSCHSGHPARRRSPPPRIYRCLSLLRTKGTAGSEITPNSSVLSMLLAETQI